MRIGLVSLGCPKNLVDSEVMLGLARDAGHDVTASPGAADVLVVNTCAFVEEARQESVETVLELARQKTDGRCRRLIVTGCLAERYGEELQRHVPEIDVVLGTGDVPGIVAAIEGRPSGTAPLPFWRGGDRPAGEAVRPLAARHRPRTRALPTYLYDAETPRLRTTPRHYAYVKVAEGCDYNCAFCVIPTLRGAYRSRPADSIVREAERLVAEGVRELILISQDTTFYGIDRRERGALAGLLRRLDRIDGLTWIRLLYLYPTTVTADTLDAMADCAKVCAYIDMPLQHAADTMLARMRRPGSQASYERLIDLIRRRLPEVALRTTFITGFPGETAREFETLRAFVERVGFDHVGVFTYSHEEGTAAFGLADDVPPGVKDARRDVLMDLQRGLVAARQRQRIGARVEVMVDGPSDEHPLVWHGRLAGQAPDIDSAVYLTDCDVSGLAPGRLLPGEVIDARGYDLTVRPVELAQPACYSVGSAG
jgi:ribosomal protein S12 methylthiotransferase